ncbi:tRNA dihydrouridine synthase DusB [Patescibacteria group bacterium]
MKTFWNNLKKPFFCLAPIAGYTDQAMRQICKKFGADLVFTEMISVNAVVHSNKTTQKLLKYSEKERPIVVQLFGNDPEYFAKAVKIVEKLGFDGIDINMGCPARKVFNNQSGVGLLKNKKLALEIVKSTVKATKLPVSVKTRPGINDSKGFLEFAKDLEKAGIKALSIHGRTYKQGFVGEVDWDLIGEVKRELKITVIGNGGIDNPKEAKKCLEKSKVDGLMIARGAIGNPWIFDEIKDFLKTGNLPKPKSSEERFKMMLEHAKLMVKLKGEKRGMQEMRKHFVKYVHGLPKAREMREKLVRVSSLEELEKLL